MKTIICRADGNAKVGLGHLYRMFALYEMYKDTFEVIYVTREDSELKVIPSAYNLKVIPSAVAFEDEHLWLNENFDAEECIVLIDGYHFVDVYQKQLKTHNFYVMYVDDLVTQKSYADIIVNHSPNLERQDFNTDKNALIALGTKYAILRPAFLEAAKQSRVVGHIDTAFVCFGGADALDLSLKATKALLEFSQIKTIHVILGGAYKHSNIFELATTNSGIQLHQNLSEHELIAVMETCHFAIVPSSTILYEICCVKMPVLSGYFVDNQKNIYSAFSSKKLVYPGGDFSKYTEADFKVGIESIIQTGNYQNYIEHQAQLFDAKIKQRFLDLLIPIRFRSATFADCKLIFDWANDELVRKNSFNSNAIAYKDHESWFQSKLETSNEMFLIAESVSQPVGLVRYTVEENNAIVGISIAKDFRGKSLASKLLTASSEIYFKSHTLPIFAYIKKTNLASIKAFQNAGYIYLEDVKIKDVDSVIYQLRNNEYESR